ncbi:hypothetical protein N7492_007888 [Penicillium capsulatum]|uniref:Amine oxidase domain-containing protein n=1 Tax=Penicillium capsulatum TaxID=69766 RepID=A0A9W9LMK1_9EURO|nr:hypothetical protein N7492_007888 [Penicillium capsulatum]KAJ6117719.1 hypothetical protein N7512_007444 [Penicillium capsulatum]
MQVDRVDQGHERDANKQRTRRDTSRQDGDPGSSRGFSQEDRIASDSKRPPGPAGLFAAYALLNDGFSVVIFDKNDSLALDGHSHRMNHAVVDIPMRTFAGKYYANLFQMLNRLEIPTQIHRFQYLFLEGSRLHAQFGSNFHRIEPCLQNGLAVNLYLLFCYLWYTIAVFLFPPRVRKTSAHTVETETLEQYARRIALPDLFLDGYLLPLFSSVATCSHQHLRECPAAYIANYRRKTLATHHRTVSDMGWLQTRPVEGARFELQREVISVDSRDSRVVVQHRPAADSDLQSPTASVFDYAIRATSVAEASRIHPASAAVTSQLSTCLVRVTVTQSSKEQKALQRFAAPSEVLMLDTREGPAGAITRSTHLHPSGVAVTVAAYSSGEYPEHSTDALHTVELIRPLPTPQSHDLLLNVFGHRSGMNKDVMNTWSWRNGAGHVYLAGGYASAGLPLLEACVRSGLEAAEAIGAKLPFDLIRPTPF